MSQPEKTLFLFDAFALIYRAHFAFSRNPRISSKGVNTGVPFGFTNAMLEVIQKQKPTHMGVVFDTFAPTFRDEVFEEYKAGRQATPEDVKVGIPLVKDIVKAWNIPALELDGYEADDIIGTISKRAAKEGFTVYMMTPDKDFSQLVQEKVFLYKPAYMGNSVDILGVEEVKAKWGIEKVEQVIDILGLQGDSSDNIPGIPGVGPKTAVKFIEDYGSVENLVKHAHELKGKQKENVENFGEQAIMSKELATINTEVPIEFELDDFEYKGPDEDKLKPIFRELEFRTLLQRVFGESSTKAPAETGQIGLFDQPKTDEKGEQAEEEPEVTNEPQTLHAFNPQYHLIHTAELRKSLLDHLNLQQEYAFTVITLAKGMEKETEADPMDDDLVGISFSYYQTEAYYIPIPDDSKDAGAILSEFKSLFEDEDKTVIGQDLKYDVMLLQKYGIELKSKLFDCKLVHYLLEPETSHQLSVMAENYLNYIPIAVNSLTEKGKKPDSFRDIELPRLTDYAGERADLILKMKEYLQPRLKDETEKLYWEVELPLLLVLADIEYAGVKIDVEGLAEMSAELEKDCTQLQDSIYAIAGEEFNISSPKQLGDILFEKLKLVEKAKKTKSGQYATGEEVLSKLAGEHEIVQKILDYREFQKLKTTYVDALPTLRSPLDDRIHTNFAQTVAATGRLSSNNPNLQNIPIRTARGREIRKAFVKKDKDHLILSADYSQIELRIVASFAKDKHMVDAFKNGRDIHATTASRVFGVPLEEVDQDMRRKAKEVNFGLIYGMSAFGLAERLQISRGEAKEIMDSYFGEFDAVKRYMDESINIAREQEYVETILGRKRYLRDINSRNFTTRSYAERNAINAPIQGSAADIIKVAMVNLHQWMKTEKLKSQMILQVHDELVFDAHKSEIDHLEKKAIELMMDAIKLEVPLEVETGRGENWLEAH